MADHSERDIHQDIKITGAALLRETGHLMDQKSKRLPSRLPMLSGEETIAVLHVLIREFPSIITKYGDVDGFVEQSTSEEGGT